MQPVLLSSIKKGRKFRFSPTSEDIFTLVDFCFETGLMECIHDNYDYTETFTDEVSGEEITVPAWPKSLVYSYFEPYRLVFPL